jgi:hypothetical protein
LVPKTPKPSCWGSVTDVRRKLLQGRVGKGGWLITGDMVVGVIQAAIRLRRRGRGLGAKTQNRATGARVTGARWR